MQNRRVKP